jgi:hypothetical protein
MKHDDDCDAARDARAMDEARDAPPELPELDNTNGVNIGSVTFMRRIRLTESDEGMLKYADDIFGNQRIRVLRAFYRGEPLLDDAGSELVPWVQGRGRITRFEVYWRTAGERVTS